MTHSPDSYTLASRAARFMILLNLSLCIVKFLAGWLGGSFALIADGVNNLADVGASAVLFLGLSFARRPADRNHAYGHGRFEQEISRIISIVVLVTGGGIVVGGAYRLSDLHDPPDYAVLVVALFGILLKLYMYRYQKRLADRLSSSALAADALNHQSDAAATVCVLVGTAAIWIGGPSWAPADDVAAILIGILMIVASGKSILEASSELLDQMPPPEIIDRIRSLAEAFPGVAGVEKIIGRKTGMHYLIDMHLEVPGRMTVSEGHSLGHQVKARLMDELPEIGDVDVHIEPGSPPSSGVRPDR